MTSGGGFENKSEDDITNIACSMYTQEGAWEQYETNFESRSCEGVGRTSLLRREVNLVINELFTIFMKRYLFKQKIP